MKDPLKSANTKSSFGVNFKIREIYSEAALASFCDEIDNKFPTIERKWLH